MLSRLTTDMAHAALDVLPGAQWRCSTFSPGAAELVVDEHQLIWWVDFDSGITTACWNIGWLEFAGALSCCGDAFAGCYYGGWRAGGGEVENGE